MNQYYPFINPPLPYSYDALEPFIDTKTMEKPVFVPPPIVRFWANFWGSTKNGIFIYFILHFL